MTSTANIEQELRAALPAEQHPLVPGLAQLLADVIDGELSPAQTQARFSATPQLFGALQSLGGQQLSVASAAISFGEGAQVGDITVRDIAGRDMFKLKVNISTYIAHQTVYTTTTRSPQEMRNRNAMLQKVEHDWINGVLEKSLYHEARIELGLKYDPSVVEHPRNAFLQRPNREDKPLQPSRPMIEVFDELAGEMLILGAPGAGKTTLLLELARSLIARARADDTLPMPVVFNLSTWAIKRLSLVEWLKGELNERYDVPRKIAAQWIEDQQVLPLLDGLDEVFQEAREGCVKAINDFRQTEYGLVPLVVGSRIGDYEVLTTRLRLRGAIVIQPLTEEDVERYLQQVGDQLEGVRGVLREDLTVYELLDNPLMLSIVSLAYKGRVPFGVHSSIIGKDRRYQLFDDYIQAMFQRLGRSGGTERYLQQQTTHWLSSLAHRLVTQKLTVLYIEQIQSTWLRQSQRRRLAQLSFLVIGLVAGLVGGLVGGLIVGIFFGLRFDLLVGLVAGLVGGLVVGLLGGLGGGLVGKLVGGYIEPVEELRWSWSKAKSSLVIGLPLAVFVGLVVVVLVGLVGGLVVGLVVGLVIGLVEGLVRTSTEVRTRPNQGIRLSLKSGSIYGSLFGIVYGLITGLVFGLIFGIGFGIAFGIVIGLMFGLAIGLASGWAAFFQHYTLRFLLYRNGSLPFRDLVPWLDYCAERLFLRKVGGGYIFVHRLLMEHFAAKYQEPDK